MNVLYLVCETYPMNFSWYKAVMNMSRISSTLKLLFSPYRNSDPLFSFLPFFMIVL